MSYRIAEANALYVHGFATYVMIYNYTRRDGSFHAQRVDLCTEYAGHAAMVGCC